MSTHLLAIQVPTFGFVPRSFPRDPIFINQFAEHMLIGQILQPLTDTDQLGNVIPSIASKWHFEDNGKKIIFEIDQSIKFSNGKNVNSIDVKYTIERHIKKKSQSSAFFRAVSKLETPNESTLILILKYADVSLVKVLSRDHLGIVPNGWEFNEKSSTPFIGSGPYNLTKVDGKWYLESSMFYKNQNEINIKKVELVYFKDDSYNIDYNSFPEIVPLISKKNFEEYKSIKSEIAKECTTAEEMTFSQSSAWWNPHSKYFKDKKIRSIVLSFLDEQFRIFAKNKNLKLATGFIPVGIMGHLPERLLMKDESEITNLKIKVSSSSAIFKEIFSSEQFLNEMKKRGIEFIFKSISAINVRKDHEEFKPDITIGSWGGGFNDPTGFLGPLEEDLGMSFEEYLGIFKNDFLKAQSEQDWKIRANIFRTIARSLVENHFMTPGFRNEQFSCLQSAFEKKEVSLRYTPRLINYVRKIK
jgi:MarR-like DNA-binding transcriptional regulator SgrR of sgrS sRNA